MFPLLPLLAFDILCIFSIYVSTVVDWTLLNFRLPVSTRAALALASNESVLGIGCQKLRARWVPAARGLWTERRVDLQLSCSRPALLSPTPPLPTLRHVCLVLFLFLFLVYLYFLCFLAAP